jgi:two-component system CheB/CheR fusion protein
MSGEEVGQASGAGVDSPSGLAGPTKDSSGIAVVGIGASAGGLEAFRSLFGALPPDTGMAFVVVQHLSPEHPSVLAKTLTRLTSMPVLEVQSGMRLEPNRVYVMPSNAEVSVGGGALQLTPRPASPGGRLPINGLFRSLAAELRERAIGVVLSGTGEDGTDGLKDIKADGGITFAQEPASAQFSGMPASASAAGVVDRVLPPDRIAVELARLSRHPYVLERAARDAEPSLKDRDWIIRILSLIRKQSGVDFSVYKPSTVGRRISRRMALHRIGSVAEYVELVEKQAGEAKALAEDLLIHVTGFFRDPEVFEALKRAVFPPLLAQKREGPIRVWVPGCSSGEEVYSLAMCLLEHQGDSSQEADFQIFGSDLSERAIERARAGFYPESALRELGAGRLGRFFTRAGEDHRIAKGIRDRCVFVVHDLTRDPPFAKLDLISCRNVLIYFGEDLHERLLHMFHYCLNRPGFLVIGRSENVTRSSDLFEPNDLEHRIFSRVGEVGRFSFPMKIVHRAGPVSVGTARPGLSRAAAEAQRQADHLLLTRFAPPGVIVNEQLEIVHFRGRTGDFLEQPPGQPQTNLIKMARGSLLSELRRALAEAKERGVSVQADGVQVIRGGRKETIAVEVLPLLSGRESGDHYYLVLFHGDHEAPARVPPLDLEGGDAAAQVRRLQEDLAATRQYLESLVEQHQSSDDEFATVTEELIAANEELQSTNEELESAKEELQSANEELTTLNDELRARNSELDRVANDLSNILEAADIPIVIVDGEQKIRRFTPGARGLFTLIPSDIGRSIDDIKLNFDAPDLHRRIQEVAQRLEARDWEVQDASGRWLRMKIQPYHAGERGPDGAVLSFVDVDVLKKALRDAEDARDYARAIVETVRVPLLVIDEHCRFVSANPSFERVLPGEGDGKPVRAGEDVFASFRGAFDVTRLRQAAQEALAGARPPRIDVQIDSPGVESRTFAVTARLARPAGRPIVLLAFEDLTELRRFEEERSARLAAEASNRTKDLFLATLSHELRTPLSTILLQAQILGSGSPEPKVQRASGAIYRAATNQKRLIDDLLDVSRIVSGKLGLDQHVVDFGAIVEGAVEEARVSAEAKGVTLSSAIEPGPSAVYADPSRMQQVVSNLLTNAIKFTASGGSVSVTLERSGSDGRVTVRDTGVGIRREFLPHLFNRFTQADSSATRHHGGLGLGLAIAKHIVDLHGGTVGADSAGEGRGFSAWVTLPLVRAPALRGATPAPARPVTGVAGLRVLVVEDDEGTRESLVEILSRAGAEARAAASADEGLSALEEFKPDVLLSDLAMPVRDGFGLIAQVRSLPAEKGGRIPAAALSALVGVDDRQRALAAGFQLHVPKPVDAHGLLSAVARLAATRQR